MNDRQRTACARYRAKHPDRLKARSRAWYAANREKKLERGRVWREANREFVRERSRTVYEAKPARRAQKAAYERTEKTKATRKAFREKNPRSEYARRYEAAYRERRKVLHEQKQGNDPQYRLRRALRSRLKNAIRKNQKSGSAVATLGCSIEQLRLHLESQFAAGMSWANFGRLDSSDLNWQIDHIRPLSRFDLTDPLQLREACHFSNLRPLWALDNRRKGNKIVEREGGATWAIAGQV